jgi:hypothetical protein
MRTSEEIARLTQERRLMREEKKDKKKMKQKYPGNKDWYKGMPTSPNPAGRPKGKKNSFSKRTKAQMRRIFEQMLYEIEIDKEKYTPTQRLKAVELIGKFVIEEKKTITKEVKRINSVIIDVTGQWQNPEINSNQKEIEGENSKFYLEEADDEEDNF